MIEKNKARIKEREEIKKHIVMSKPRQISLFNRIITILHELNAKVINFYLQTDTHKKEFREDIPKQLVQTLFKKSISQTESILILIENGKYLEAYSLLRNLFESAIFLLYITEYPFEAERWLNFQKMDFKVQMQYKKNNKKLHDFKNFLTKNNHRELLNCINSDNFQDYRDFSIWFIREQAFKKHSSIDGDDFKEFYFQLSKFVHPSIAALNYNDKLSETHFDDIFADILYIAKRVGDIYISYFQNILLSRDTYQQFLHIKEEIGQNLAKIH